MATNSVFLRSPTHISSISIVHLWMQQIQIQYVLWIIRSVEEVHPTTGSELNWDKEKT